MAETSSIESLPRPARRLLDALRRLEHSLPKLGDELAGLRKAATDETSAAEFSLHAASVALGIRAVENDLEIVRHTVRELPGSRPGGAGE